MNFKNLLAMVAIVISGAISARASSVGLSGGQVLIRPSAARPAALGGAFCAAADDISAMAYNPSALSSLSSAASSFLYEKRSEEGAFGDFAIGAPLRRGGIGLRVGYSDEGKIDLFDGLTEQTVRARTDLFVSLSHARRFGRVDFGVAGKYLSSELAGRFRASAYAADFGAGLQMGRARFGAALQNIGTELTFEREGDPLPRVARLGASYALQEIPMMLFSEAGYLINERDFQPGIGVEYQHGVLALRAGYRRVHRLGDLTFGAGFMWGASSIDYAFGLRSAVGAEHRISLATRFNARRP